ncbi:hypothetical protein D3C71_1937250 [compost metagenome]
MTGDGANSDFYIQLADIPARACTDIVTKTYKSFSVIKGTKGTAPTSTTGAYTTIAAAVAGCGGTSETAKVTMNFMSK